jgi:predicted anti-sigma-YlaC factor YlaD
MKFELQNAAVEPHVEKCGVHRVAYRHARHGYSMFFFHESEWEALWPFLQRLINDRENLSAAPVKLAKFKSSAYVYTARAHDELEVLTYYACPD